MAAPLRALFLNEGDLGAGVLGHAPVEAAIRAGLRELDGIEARFVRLPAFGRAAQAAAAEVPVLARADLDLQATRWHLVQAVRARRVVRRELAQSPADVLHVNSHSIAFGLVDVMRRLPTFLSLDATVWDWHSLGAWRTPRRHSRALLRPSRALERRALEASALVLAWTDWARLGVERVAPRAGVVTHNAGVDLETFRPAPRRERVLPRVLFVGGRFEQKGGLDLLEALGPDLGRTVELDVVTPAAVAPAAGLRVHRLGRDDPALLDLFQQADVFCLPTHADSMGWVILEAMACGVPVVATGVGGIPDVLGSEAGVLVPPRDVTSLRGELHRLLASPEERGRLGSAARRRAEERFDARVQTARMVELMRAVLVDAAR